MASVNRIKRAEKKRKRGAGGLPPARRAPVAPPRPGPSAALADDAAAPIELPYTFLDWCLEHDRLVVDAADDALSEPDSPADAPEPTVWDVLEAGNDPREVARYVRGACVTQSDAVQVLTEALAIVRRGGAEDAAA
jgi:hypothetical protein